MWPFTRKKVPYNRSKAMEDAAKARAKGNFKKAITEYQKILEHEPDNVEALSRIAPLLAERQQYKQAWQHFVRAADGFVQKGWIDKAIAVYVQAASYLPGLVEVWQTIARMQMQQRRRGEAVKALLDGRAYFKNRKYRTEAITLLRCVRELEPLHLDASLDLARLLRQQGNKIEAYVMLESLLPSYVGTLGLRRIRAAMFRIGPTPAAAWRWLRAALWGK